MTPSPRLIVAGSAIVLLFAGALGFSQRANTASIGDPARSWLAGVTRLFPARSLQPKELRSVGCFDRATSSFVVAASTTCAFSVASGVKQIKLTWQSGPRTTLTVARTNDLTQIYHSDDPPQKAGQPGRLDIAIIGSGSTVNLACDGPAECRVSLR
jgi:hypothetical protein